MAFKMNNPFKQWASMIRIAPKSSISDVKGGDPRKAGNKKQCERMGKGWSWVEIDGKYGCHQMS